MRRLLTPAFLLTLGLLILGEVGARLFFAHSVSGRFEYGFSLDAGFMEHPDGRVELVMAGGRRFLPQSFQRKRPPGVFRVFVIGDSVTRGPSLKQAYPWFLQEELQRQGIDAEVLNLGVAGNGARRSRLIFLKILDYDPSLIVLHVNNSNEYEDEREYRRAQEFKGWHPRHWPMKVFIFRRLYEAKMEKLLWRLVPQTIRQRFAVNDADAEVAASQNPEKWQQWQRLVAEVTSANVALARELRVPLILLTQCRLDAQGSNPARLTDEGLDEMARNLAGRAGVLHLSLKELFAPLDFKDYFQDSSHLKPAGHQLLARALAEKVGEILAQSGGAHRVSSASPGRPE
jgi:lysophospholipase L1-like esterase|uniref:SGNH/GDSL hydrolase family protein n=1 Tax=Desulfobacca acetoxidans TaxID=60893 RepID=A0A7C5AMZ8_9BACT